MRAPRPFVSGLLSVLLPGAGQAHAGRLRRGGIVLGAALLGVVLVVLLLPDRRSLISNVVRPEFLMGLLAADIAFLVFRLWAVADAYHLAAVRRKPPRTRSGRLTAVVGLAVLALATALPHVAAGWAILTTSTTLDAVFADQEPNDVLGSASGWSFDNLSLASAAAAATPTRPRAQAAAAKPAPRRAAKPRAPAALWDVPGAHVRKGQWLNILLIGGDAGYLRYGLRADTLIVVSLQEGTRRAVAFSIPRNLEYVPLPGRAAAEYGHFPDIINALYEFGQDHPDLFPGGKDAGATALKQTISNLLGIPIHYYALVDLRGFVEVVDALGGIEVAVTENLDDRTSPAFPGEPWTPIQVSAGHVYHFDGREALAYARTRWQSSDYTRMIRQRCLLSALAGQIDPIQVIRHLGKLSHAAKEYVRTDIPLSRLPDLIKLVAAINPWTSAGISFTPPTYDTYRPEVEPYREAVREALTSTPRQLWLHTGVKALAGSCRDEP